MRLLDKMFLNVSYYFAISAVVIILLVVFIYIWRKINEGELYTKVLEKKLTNLKKENNDLRSLLDKYSTEEVSIDFAENIMNDVFGEKAKKCSGNVCQIQEIFDDKVHDAKNETVCEETSSVITVEEIVEINDKTLEDEVASMVSESSDKYSRTALNKMNLEKLKEVCNSMKLSNNGTKAMLIDRILRSK